MDEVLKGDTTGDEILVKTLAFDQTQPDQHEIDVNVFSSYNINEPGIWLIDIRRDEEPPLMTERGNYLPLNTYDAVKAAISDHD